MVEAHLPDMPISLHVGDNSLKSCTLKSYVLASSLRMFTLHDLQLTLSSISCVQEICSLETGEVAWELKVPVALPEDPSSIPITHIWGLHCL